MITDIESYLGFFDSLRRRTERDVAALPPAAVDWTPPPIEGEVGWTIGQIVGHIGSSRLYFASAYRNEGWIWQEPAIDPGEQSTWLPWLETSASRFTALVHDTPATGVTFGLRLQLWFFRRGAMAAWMIVTLNSPLIPV